MAVNWERRPVGEEAPDYLPGAELFTIKMHYATGMVERFAGFVDFCSADQISRIELLAMAREFSLDVTNCKMWWLDVSREPSELREIRDDMDALNMANSVSSPREVYVLLRILNSGPVEMNSEGEEESGASDTDLVDLVISSDRKVNRNDEDLEFHDSDYEFSSESSGDEVHTNMTARAMVVVDGEPPKSVNEPHSESDYANSDEFQSCSSTDEEELISKRPKYSEFNEQCDMSNPQFKIGMKFSSFKQFKDVVRNYGIRNRYVLNFKPNSQKRCKAFCKKNCPFYLWASPMVKDSNTIQIKSGCLKHECAKDHNNRHVNAKWIAKTYLEQFRADPTWKVAGIIQAVKINQEVDISRLKAYRAKCIALRIIDGDEQSQWTRLYDYRLELLKTHPGSTIKFKCDAGVFEGMYICLAPLSKGFLAGCRQVIFVDGCFLKGQYGGQLLTAVGIDANDCIYPIAWATVGIENKDNWLWFLEHLAADLQINNSNQWAFMSDRQKGLLPAIQELFPDSEHRFCVRHIHTNFKQNFRGKALKDQLWACATATSLPAFDRAMVRLKDMSLGAYEYMKKIDPRHWTRSHFQSKFKCDILLNNMCECFNSNILEARIKGIVTMNEMIRTQLMIRIQKRRDSMKKCTTLHCPRIMKKLEKLKKSSFLYSTTWSGGDQYQVLGPDGQFVVDNIRATCSCRRWQLTGVPCSHAISVIFYNNDRVENYLHSCYKVSTYMDIYCHTLSPTHDKDAWPKSDQGPMIPPQPISKRRGRKKMLRRKEVGEETRGFTNGRVSKKGVTNKCSICGATGHNKRFHGGVKEKESSTFNRQDEQTSGASQCNPMDSIHSQVLHDHNPMVDGIIGGIQTEPVHINTHAQRRTQSTSNLNDVTHPFEDPISQVFHASNTGQDMGSEPGNETVITRQKIKLKGGKGTLNTKAQHTSKQITETTSRFPVFKHQRKDKDGEDRHKDAMRRKIWVPPGGSAM